MEGRWLECSFTANNKMSVDDDRMARPVNRCFPIPGGLGDWESINGECLTRNGNLILAFLLTLTSPALAHKPLVFLKTSMRWRVAASWHQSFS